MTLYQFRYKLKWADMFDILYIPAKTPEEAWNIFEGIINSFEEYPQYSELVETDRQIG